MRQALPTHSCYPDKTIIHYARQQVAVSDLAYVALGHNRRDGHPEYVSFRRLRTSGQPVGRVSAVPASKFTCISCSARNPTSADIPAAIRRVTRGSAMCTTITFSGRANPTYSKGVAQRMRACVQARRDRSDCALRALRAWASGATRARSASKISSFSAKLSAARCRRPLALRARMSEISGYCGCEFLMPGSYGD